MLTNGHRQDAVKLFEVELSDPLLPMSIAPYSRALSLVRLHGYPLGLVALEADAADGVEVSARQTAEIIWRDLAEHIRAHLRSDGAAVPRSLPPSGLSCPSKPRCCAERDAVRAQAPPATIVVATRERPESLLRCLQSLLELDYPRYEVVVVDNAPRTAATQELISSDAYRSRVTYVREDRPGLAAAHNRGLLEASGRFVAFTDDDVTVDPLWLLELAHGFQVAEEVACVTGLIIPAELETPAQLAAESLWGFGKGFSQRVFDRSTPGGDPLYPYAAGTFGSGANMAFDLAALRELGGFDPATGAGTLARGGDDLAGFLSVISEGYRLVYNPAALIRHTHHRDFPALRRQAYGYGVGLTAYLTKAVIDHPGRLLELGRLAPQGVARARDPRASGHTADSGQDGRRWRSELAWAERWGMVCGPAAYVRSRRRVRGLRPTLAPTDARR